MDWWIIDLMAPLLPDIIITVNTVGRFCTEPNRDIGTGFSNS